MKQLLVSVLCLWGMALACSPEGEESLPQENDLLGKTYFSHAVVIGRAIQLYPDRHLGSSAYTVALQVDCVVKDIDGKVPGGMYNITEAGFIEGMCHSAEFQLGFSYIVFLREDFSSDLYKPWTQPAMNTNANKQEVLKACGLQPVGGRCPEPPSSRCEPDRKGYAQDQLTHSHDHHDSIRGHDDHHDHDDHHHDDDHEHYEGDGHDHHAHGHDHHDDEDYAYDHDHHDHHQDGEDFDHDHDHDSHHENKVTDEEGQESAGHREVMSVASCLLLVLMSCVL